MVIMFILCISNCAERLLLYIFVFLAVLNCCAVTVCFVLTAQVVPSPPVLHSSCLWIAASHTGSARAGGSSSSQFWSSQVKTNSVGIAHRAALVNFSNETRSYRTQPLQATNKSPR